MAKNRKCARKEKIKTKTPDMDVDLDMKPYKALWSESGSCFLSLSPTEDLMVIANKKRAVFIAKKCSPKSKDDPHLWNDVYWKGELCQDEEEQVSAVLCVPLASQQRSSQGSPDCSCVIVGFTSGYVRIYLQTGVQLLSQFLHDGPVSGLDLRTKLSVKDANSIDQQLRFNVNLVVQQGEELIILYPNAIVVIDGFSLFMALKACRNQIAKAQASKTQEVIQPPPLAYRKWRLHGQEKVYDIVNCGMVTQTVFDRLVVSSFNSDSRQIASSGTRKFITSGVDPFIGWYELKEENSAPLMSEVAFNVASKLTTAFISSISHATSDWIGLGLASKFRSQPAKDAKPPKPPVEMGTPIKLRYGIPDKRRQAESIFLSPDGSLAACTDDFGRILVISNDTGLVVRMLKGYRDAQCGWIVVDDRQDEQIGVGETEKKIRQALFLVIYAPRRGILEIWLAEQGNRVGAFNVGKDCRLIYNGYGTLGSRVSSFGASSAEIVSCFLMEGNGSLSSISVPFHCSLSLLHSLRARDSYLLQKIAVTLEKGFTQTKEDDQIATLKQLFQEMEAPETFFQAVQKTVSSKKLSSRSMSKCISSIKEILAEKAENTGPGNDIEYIAELNGIISVCQNNLNLIELYDFQKLLHDATSKDSSLDSTMVTPEDLTQLLRLSDKDKQFFHDAQGLENEAKEINENLKNELTVAEFLDFFVVDAQVHMNQRDIPRGETKMQIRLPEDLKITRKLGQLFYLPFIENLVPLARLRNLIDSPYFDAEACMCLLITYCQIENLNVSKLEIVYRIMEFLLKGAAGDATETKDSLLDIWRPVRALLEVSKSVKNCLLLAYLGRGISTNLQSENEVDGQTPLWTDVTEDIEEWNELIKKLEDVFMLASFLQKGHFDDEENNQATPWHLKLSIKDILAGGKGAISQIVAAHVVRCRIPGPCVVGVTLLEANEVKKSSPASQHQAVNSEILQALMELQNRFPLSLEKDILLAHCCWECILLWKKDIEDVSVLSSAVVHLSSISSNILKQVIATAATSKHGALIDYAFAESELTVLLGLMVLFWKAIFKESIKMTFNLIEKIGKAPKDRLCRKHIGMSSTALETYLLTAHRLLYQALQTEDSSNIDFPEFQTESRWESSSGKNSSIIESALDEAKCGILSLKNVWNVTVTLWLIILTGMKQITCSMLFLPEETRAATQTFPAPCSLPEETDASIQKARSKFCLNCLSLIVEKYSCSDRDDLQQEIMSTAGEVFGLANNFNTDDEILWKSFTLELFLSGLDNAAYEVNP
eukprot:gene2830-1060_t